VEWITYDGYGASDQRNGFPAHRGGGILMQPLVELPANDSSDGGTWTFEDAVNEDFPMIHFRVRGLPAVSRDGTRVAYVYGPSACCRFDYLDLALYVVAAKTGSILKKLPLVSATDELYMPQRDGTGARGHRGAPGVSRELTEEAFHVNATRLEKIIGARARAANAELAGEWITLTSVDRDQDRADATYLDSGRSITPYRGEGLAFSADSNGDFTAFDIHRDGGRVTHVATSTWKVTLPSPCPQDRYTLTLGRVFGLRDKFILVEALEDDGPDGCETSSMRFVPL
jgi:hypothetical protein